MIVDYQNNTPYLWIVDFKENTHALQNEIAELWKEIKKGLKN